VHFATLVAPSFATNQNKKSPVTHWITRLFFIWRRGWDKKTFY